MKKVEEETINLKKLFLATNDNSACSLKDIKTICKNNKIDIILIDYTQLLRDGSKNNFFTVKNNRKRTQYSYFVFGSIKS